jgi:hypothetical protein
MTQTGKTINVKTDDSASAGDPATASTEASGVALLAQIARKPAPDCRGSVTPVTKGVMTPRCACCGAGLVANEEHLCSQNECFLRWLGTELDRQPPMAEFLCDDWRALHGPESGDS